MKKKNPYSSTIIPLPIPKLVVLYNGKTDVPDESIMRLSDAFREEIRHNLIMRQQSDDTNSEGAASEINEEEAVNKALDDMPDDYELKEQLLAHRAEVIGMWINEYNEEETMQMILHLGKSCMFSTD